MAVSSSETTTCGICEERIPRRKRRGFSPHFESVHSEYVRWYRRWVKAVMLGSIVATAFLILADYAALVNDNLPLLVGANVLFAAFVSINVSRMPFKFRYFRNQWKRGH